LISGNCQTNAHFRIVVSMWS